MKIMRTVVCLSLIVVSLGLSSRLWAESLPKTVEAPSPIKVNVTGASNELAENLKALLPSLRQLSCDSPEERVERFIRASQPKLIEASEAMGYFDARFSMTSTRQANCWVLNIAVQPGDVVRVSMSNIRVTGEGESLPAFKTIMASSPYATGEVLVSQKYEDLKSALLRAASRLGFFDAKFLQQEVLVDIDNYQAVINLHFDTGIRYDFGEVNVQQDVLEGKYLDRYIRIKPGEPYDSTRLLAQTRLLESSDYYADIRISSRYRDAQGNQVPIDITAERRNRYTYTAKIGYDDSLGTRIDVGMETHWVNANGHKLDANVYGAKNIYGAKASYRVPLWNPEFEFASVSGTLEHSNINNYKLNAANLEFGYNRRNRSDWQQTAFVKWVFDSYQEADLPKQNAQLTLIGARLSKKKSDDTLFPTQGWRGVFEIQGSHKALLSDKTLLQASLRLRHLYTFSNNSKAISHGIIGGTWIDAVESMPPSLRYAAGGQNSVRGYSSRAFEGAHTLVLGSEYEYPVTEKIGIAAFVDAGNAFDQWSNVDLSIGIGAGVRYKSPLGPIRFDVAVPKDNLKDVHFYFSLGPDL